MFQLTSAAAPIGAQTDVPPAATVAAMSAADVFGAVEDEDHIVVLGGRGPELMCALLRAGATNVTHLRADERPEAASASMVIVPLVSTLDWLAATLPSIRRALSRGGRVAVHAGPTPGSQMVGSQIQIRRMLMLNGARAIHSAGKGQWLCGDLPRQSATLNDCSR
jgi:hypothetical protein